MEVSPHQAGPLRLHPATWTAAAWFLAAGIVCLVLPTMISIARFSWSTEQGGHAPLVLATGLWLLWREAGDAAPLRSPGSGPISAVLLAGLILAYLGAHIINILEIEGLAMYGALLVAAYLFLGLAVLKRLWFPLLYLCFIFPPPNTLVATITQPIKILISEQAVNLLHGLGYPVGSSGVTIHIAQYDLLVAAACAGLNSLISLTAICLFYVYVRHRAEAMYALLLMLAIVPVAIFSNFARVMTLILLTYYCGDATAQGFMHDFAGLLMFAVAMATIIGVDLVAAPLYHRATGRKAHG